MALGGDEVMRRWRATKIPASLPVILGVAATIAVGALAWKWLEPPPSKEIRLATGRPGGGYYAFGQELQARMKTHGFEVELVETAGGVENQKLLVAGEVDAAFLQGGAEELSPDPQGRARSVASVYYEPLWVFRKGAVDEQIRLTDLAQAPVAIGEPGSGTHAVVRRLFELNDLETSENLLEIGGDDAIAALKSGKVQAAFMIMSPEAETLKNLLELDGVHLVNFSRHRAYARNLHFIRDVHLSEGILDLAKNLPDREVTVLTTAAQLAVTKELHPGIVQLFLREGTELFGKRGLLEDPNEFPSKQYLTLELHPGAEDGFIGGPSFLSEYLPFDAVIAIKRTGLVLLPMLTILLPLFKIVPMVYAWQMRRRIYRWYVDLIELEGEISDGGDLTESERILAQLEDEIRNVVDVPPSYRRDYYLLRTHVDYVRKKLTGHADVATTGGESDAVS
jgi:TRAP-type uncharacterized transport system substrate-binding protein